MATIAQGIEGRENGQSRALVSPDHPLGQKLSRTRHLITTGARSVTEGSLYVGAMIVLAKAAVHNDLNVLNYFR